MEIDLLHARRDLSEPSLLAPTWITRANNRLRVAGDDTGAQRRFVYVTPDVVGAFTSWDALVAALRAASALRVSPAGCQFMLAYGLVPPPYTLYADVHALGVGDRIELGLDDEYAQFSTEFPFLESRSTHAEQFDVDRLERHIVRAVERAIDPGEPVLLMQSAGKDSAALLLGLAQCRHRDAVAVTYHPRHRENEAPHAAALARKLGVRHEIISADATEELRLILEFVETAPAISADVALAGYLRVLDAQGARSGVVLDGLGNDIYMGYVQPRREAALGWLSMPRLHGELWGRWEPMLLGARASYLAKTSLMYPCERMLAGSRLSPRAVRELIPIDTPFTKYFATLDASVRGMDPTDRRAYVRGRIYDGAGTMEKARLATAHFGARVEFPFCDRELVDYCFNLPRREKYDAHRRVGKIALRRLLDRAFGEQPFFADKGSFRYDVSSFVDANADAIAREVRAASHVLRNLDTWLPFLIEHRANYVHAYSLFTLFILGAWLARRLPRELELLSARASVAPNVRVREFEGG